MKIALIIVAVILILIGLGWLADKMYREYS
jgi:hypothetical protein